jgi:pimeloyl-ACP methyl ester carboxylesterase
MTTSETFATFLPGAAGFGNFWSPVVERLPSTWRTQLVDLPGFGPVPPRPDVVSYDSLVDHVAGALSDPAVLVGQSMGGFVALQLALRYPQLVTHLVLAVAAGGVDMAAQGASDWRADYRRSHPQAQTWVCDAVPDLTDELRTITIPVLLLWATRDPLSPLSVALKIASEIPHAQLVTFETDDHWIARQRPDGTAQAIRAFIDETGPRATVKTTPKEKSQ